jgi:hypothetical protein
MKVGWTERNLNIIVVCPFVIYRAVDDQDWLLRVEPTNFLNSPTITEATALIQLKQTGKIALTDNTFKLEVG